MQRIPWPRCHRSATHPLPQAYGSDGPQQEMLWPEEEEKGEGEKAAAPAAVA